MSGSYSAGRRAVGYCDRCGFEYRLNDLKPEVTNYRETGLRVCESCWDPDHPQLHVNELEVEENQALKDPRPTGSTSGRELPYAYRWDFTNSVVTNEYNSVLDSTPTIIDGWYSRNGVIGWNSESGVLNLVSDGSSGAPGDPYVVNGDPGFGLDPISIDASVYKFVTTVFRVNRFPDFEPEDRYPYDFQGQLYWLTDPSTIFSGSERNKRSQRVVMGNSPTSSFYKLSFDMSDDPTWTGTVVALRLDYFDSQNSAGSFQDVDAGDIDIDYIAVEAYHNPDL